jgi:rod shape-determining protein MreD
LAAIALVQSSVLLRFSLGGARLQLMLLVVVSWSLLRGAREGVLWGFLGGLALDFLSGLPLGSCALTLTLTAYLASLGQITLYRTSPLFPSGLALTASIVHDCLLMVLLSLLGHTVAWPDLFLQVALPSAVLGSLAMPLVHRGLTRLHERTLPEEIEL